MFQTRASLLSRARSVARASVPGVAKEAASLPVDTGILHVANVVVNRGVRTERRVRREAVHDRGVELTSRFGLVVLVGRVQRVEERVVTSDEVETTDVAGDAEVAARTCSRGFRLRSISRRGIRARSSRRLGARDAVRVHATTDRAT